MAMTGKVMFSLSIRNIKRKCFCSLMGRNTNPVVYLNRNIVYNTPLFKNETEGEVVQTSNFCKTKDKTKNNYLQMIQIFINRDNIYRRGHVDFIYSALRSMEEFGVHKDLEVYRALIDVMPKGKFVASNIIQAEFMHYPKQQNCIIDLLQQMEDNGVMPDAEMQDQLLNIFGRRGHPLRKYWRMMYWMPKFKYADPYSIPRVLPNDALELAKIAIHKISSIDLKVKVTEYQTKEIENSIDDTWIISAQSPTQMNLIEKHNSNEPIYVEGAFQVWIRDKQVNYFILRASPKPEPDEKYDEDDVSNIEIPAFNLRPPIHKHIVEKKSIHEQEDGIILALCATGTSSKDSLLSWIRHLERNGNPKLSSIPVVFTLRSSPKEVANPNTSEESDLETLKS